MASGLDRMDKRVQRLEDALDARRLSGPELAKAVRDLMDLKMALYNQLESRPVIKEALQKYQKLMKAADEQDESSSYWASAIRSELLLQEIPRLRAYSGVFETFHQLESILDQTSAADFSSLCRQLEVSRTTLQHLETRVDNAAASSVRFAETQAATVSVLEDKILEMDERLS